MPEATDVDSRKAALSETTRRLFCPDRGQTGSWNFPSVCLSRRQLRRFGNIVPGVLAHEGANTSRKYDHAHIRKFRNSESPSHQPFAIEAYRLDRLVPNQTTLANAMITR